jgi:DNA-binding MarR family transcriptional regulator
MIARVRKRTTMRERTRTGTNAEGPQPGYVAPLTVSHSDLLQLGRDDAFREMLYLVVSALALLQTCREAFAREMRLSSPQFAVLMGTAYRQGSSGVSIRDLSDHVQMASTHVTTEVGRLQTAGLVEKLSSAEDRRRVLVRLTPDGEALIERAAPFIRSVNDFLFAGYERQDLEAMQRLFHRLNLNGEHALAEIRRHRRGMARNEPSSED